MRKSNYLLSLLLLSGVTLLNISCKKDKTTSSCTLTDANFAGSYKIGTVEYKLSASSPAIDGSSYIGACRLDDVTTFNSNHTYTYTDAGIKCSPPGDSSGVWSLSGTIITISTTNDTIQNFSCSGFSSSKSNVEIQGDMVTVTFTKQ